MMKVKAVFLGLLLGMQGAPLCAMTMPQLVEKAGAGEPWAQLNLGAAYDHGLDGVRRDPVKARYWYRRSAEQGVAEAQFNLAHCLVTADGAAPDYQQARFWMGKAADQGLADAQFLFGVMLAEGLGGNTDRAGARRWLERAAAQGQADAQAYLKQMNPLP